MSPETRSYPSTSPRKSFDVSIIVFAFSATVAVVYDVPLNVKLRSSFTLLIAGKKLALPPITATSFFQTLDPNRLI